AGLRARPASATEEEVLREAGARPWDRDEIDQRIVREVRERSARVIDSEQQVGGYPPVKPATRLAFNLAEWDLETMERVRPAQP
ncbi:MAG: pectate lyase, partial [Opitutaceae bacterium]